MTGNELVTAVRGLMDDDQFDSATIIQNGNWVQNDLYAGTRTRQMETTATLNVTANDTTETLPTNLQTLISMRVTSPRVYDITNLYVDQDRFMEVYPNWESETAAEIHEWTDFGGAIRFSRPVLANSTIKVDYLRKPVAVVQNTDSYELPALYDELLARRTLTRCMMQNEDYAESAQEQQFVNDLFSVFVRNEGRGGIKTGPTMMTSKMNKGWSRYRSWREW